MNSRISTDEYFLRLAELASSRATCRRRSVGCVLVDTANHVLSTGHNGVAKGLPHCNEVTETRPFKSVHGRPPEHWEESSIKVYGHSCPGAECKPGEGLQLCEAIHAEQNALVQCHNISAIYTVYCTASPCVQCMRLILGTGTKRIVFRQEYPHAKSKELAERAGIEWIRLERL